MVLTDVTHDMVTMKEETFGPVVGVMKVRDMEEAVALANDSNLGLTASVWSRDRRKAAALARRLQAGAVTINDHLMSHGLAETPWGGFKQSSLGRTHGEIGFDEMTQPQVLVDDLLSFTPRGICGGIPSPRPSTRASRGSCSASTPSPWARGWEGGCEPSRSCPGCSKLGIEGLLPPGR